MAERHVIVGASLAGATAAATLREEGFDGDVTLIGEEPHPPYERPPLSKQYLRGEFTFEKALVRAPEYYAEQEIDARFGVRATRIDPANRVVELADGDRIPYDKVLVTTGSRNRRLPLPGRDLEGVYDLRTVADCNQIRSEAVPGRKSVIVGMGFIGAEVAASLRLMGVEVDAVEAFKTPLSGVLGEEIGRVVEAIHRDHGVRMYFEDSVAAFEGDRRIERVRTSAGRTLGCDFAVVGVGVQPVTDPVVGAGVEVENGIVTDAFCRTNVEGIYAAGDVTNHYHPIFGRRMRVEHWQNALRQGPAAARSMLAKGQPYDEIHWFWSDQYDYNLQYAGFLADHDKVVMRGSAKDRSFAAFYLKDGRILASAAFCI
jgi:3-phenylpropionate/trans-cinnamate dioxygenase ferredoxin reductase subunit